MMKLRFVLFLFVILTLVGTAEATGCYVETGESIQDALNNVSCSTITVNGSVAATSNLTFRNDTVFTGNTSLRTDTIISGAYQTHIINNNNVTIKNMTLNLSQSFGYGALNITRGSNITISNVWNKYSSFTGLEGCSNLLSNITIIDSKFDKIVLTKCMGNSTISRNTFNGAGNFGLDMQENSNNVVINNNTFASAWTGLRLYVGGNYIYIYDNTFSGNVYQHLQWKGYSNSVFKNNTLSGLIDSTYSAILLYPPYDMNNNSITNNIIKNNAGYGITFIYESYADTVVWRGNITNNVISGNSKGGINFSWWAVDSIVNLTNNIIVNNTNYGINYTAGTVTIGYNDVWNNSLGNYRNISAGTGDISENPLFVSSTDFHLQSQYGRWNGSAWVTDASTSPAIDAGDPTSDYSLEPESNGNRINMGAYGNTIYASKSITTDIPPSIPGIPINIASAFGKYYINTTWSAGEGNVTTDSYNVSVNGTWYNVTTDAFFNNTGLQNYAWSNVTVWAWNNTGNGNLSTSSVNLSTQLVLYSISGYVTDNYGYVVSDATVTSTGGSTTTNATGYYIITDLLNGNYSINFSKSGYATGTLSVTISGANATSQNIILTITDAQSAYKTSTCRSTLQWGEVGSALLIVLILLTAGGLSLGFMSGKLNMDTFPIQEFVVTLVIVVIIGSIGIAIINPIIIVVGCP